MSASTPSLKVSVSIEGAVPILAAFGKLGNRKTIGNTYLRIGSLAIAEEMVGWTQQAAREVGGTASVMVPYIKVRSDRVPTIAVSPTGSVLRGSSLAGSQKTFNVLAGAEFGANRGADLFSPHGFKPYLPASGGRGGEGYWFFPTARAHQAEVQAAWYDVVNKIVDDFAAGNLD